MRNILAGIISVAMIGTVSIHAASAESLKDALASAYLFNPTLKAARAQLRATDEEVPRAKSGYRPTITGQATHGYQDVETKTPGLGGDSWPRQYSVTLNQPIFSGFRTLNAVKGAEALVEAGREDLRSSEQQVLLSAVTSYGDVVRDTAILSLRENNLKVLNEQLRATNDRFQVGEVTKTDVAQSEASVSGAKSAISAAKAQLQASRATYAQLIGHAPGTLRDPGPSRFSPSSLEQSLQIGLGENPTVLSAIFRERAQHHVVKQTEGELLPSLSLQASVTRSDDSGVGANADREDIATVTGVLTVPIYQAGEVSARIRENVETQAQLRHQIDVAREAAQANVISSWGAYVAAKAQIVSDQAQVDANSVALNGVKEEEKVGQRTVLDVLDAEQALLNAQVALATDRRNLVVASYTLLSAIGRLTAVSISLSVEQYDPTSHYRHVKNKVWGWRTTVEQGEEAPIVAPVRAPGRTVGQPKGDGPAYTYDR